MSEESKEQTAQHEETGLSFKLLGMQMAKAAISKIKSLMEAKRHWVEFADWSGKSARAKRIRLGNSDVNCPARYRRAAIRKGRAAAKVGRAQARINRRHKSKQRSAHGRNRRAA